VAAPDYTISQLDASPMKAVTHRREILCDFCSYVFHGNINDSGLYAVQNIAKVCNKCKTFGPELRVVLDG